MLLLLALLAGQQTRVGAAAPPRVEPAQLDIVGETPFGLHGFQLVRDGRRCDADGNVFFIPYNTTEVVRVPADGSPAHIIDLSAELGRATSRGLSLEAMALDRQGRLHVAVFERREGLQHIAIFDRGGTLVDKVPLDFREIVAHQFAVFGSGAYLLVGTTPRSDRPRAVIANSSGRVQKAVAGPVVPVPIGSAADVGGWPEASDAVGGGGSKAFMTSTADGRILFALQGGPVSRVSADGKVDLRIELAGPPAGVLRDLKVSGPRVAAIYEVHGERPSRWWVDVYDIESGVQRARYGPVREGVLCYRWDGGLDRFDLLGGRDGKSVVLHAMAP
jgi:hypothetical protein